MEPVVHISRSTDPPIFRLPVEILGRIFLLLRTSKTITADEMSQDVQQEAADTPQPPAPHRTPWQNATEAPSWTDVLYVCQHWQAVALNHPALWTQLTHNPAWAVECIRRSRQMPLELSIEQTEANLRGAYLALQTIMPHFSRVKEVKIVTDYHDFMGYVLWCFEMTPAPCLEALSLECTACLHWISDVRVCYQLEHPEALFAQQTPNLPMVDLAHYCCLQIPPSAPLFCSLTHLEVSDPRLWKYVSVEYFVSCIANWTRLETLVLTAALPYMLGGSGVHPPYPMPALDPARRIVLPHLQQIRINGNSATCVDHFLRHLILPPYISLHLNCALFDDNVSWGARDVDPAVVALSLLENVPATTGRMVDYLRVFLDKGLLQHAQTRTIMAVPSKSLCTLSCAKIRITMHPPAGADATVAAGPFDYFGSILGQLNFARADDIVSLDIDRHFSKETWLQALSPMRRLEDLHFRCTGVGRDGASLLHGFFEAFAGDVPPVHESASIYIPKAEPEPELHYGEDEYGSRPHLMHGLLLPRLRLLDVYVANFGPAIWRRLVAVLRHRFVAGTQLYLLIAWGEEDSPYRPDERTHKELVDIVGEDVIWRIIEVCCDCCKNMAGEGCEEGENEGEEEEIL
ncbi:hypothetical protein EVG20_g2371 [Dentipellis fragilis]|uniref:Uncharacterized protein n=1 Tax=Dentipellis fragilis TaxID=205917 RepID=A0A4Y9Z707_9AGAM|nr:hypothetical protein EVG20_g2371 [Dentipellis fragilis]